MKLIAKFSQRMFNVLPHCNYKAQVVGPHAAHYQSAPEAD